MLEIIDLDMKVANRTFTKCLEDAYLDSRQIYFMNQAIEYMVRTGDLKNLSVMQQPSFTDKGNILVGVYRAVPVGQHQALHR